MRFYLLILSISVLLTGSLHINAGEAVDWKKPDKESSLIRLHSSERVFSDATFIKDAVLASSNNRQSFYVLNGHNWLSVYDQNIKRAGRLSMPIRGLSDIATAVDSKGNIHVADSEANEVVILNARGQVQSRFSAPRPYSIAVLKNGNVLIASPSNNSLLHMFTPGGRWLKSFGEMKPFDQANVLQNNALNRGKVLVDSFDNIYYVSLFALDPYVLKFSSKGKRLAEFSITGEAISLQREVAAGISANSSPDVIGGLLILTSASIDPRTNHLWISMNGSSETGLIYEYNQRGEKLKEYALAVNSHAIAGVKQVLAKYPLILASTSQGVYRFDINKNPDEAAVLSTGPCAEDQGWGECKTNCNTSASADDKDCVETLKASVDHQGSAVVQYACTRNSIGCSLRVSLCNKTTGNITAHEADLACQSAPPGGFEIIICIPDSGSTFAEGCASPVIIDTEGDGISLTNASNGVNFDINADGVPERLAWPSVPSDDAWLVLDRNGSNTIDNGQELFGNFTPQSASPTPNGFLALAEYDRPANGGNGDDRIDSRDAIFTSLRLWLDLNRNGISEPGELSTLPAQGLAGLDLDYKEKKKRDEHGNWFRYRAKAYDAQGTDLGRWAWDVFLARAR